MKKSALMVMVLLFVGAFMMSSCDTSWSEANQKKFVDKCTEELEGTEGIDGPSYCNCMLDKLMVKYDNVNDANKMPEEEMTEMAMDCLF